MVAYLIRTQHKNDGPIDSIGFLTADRGSRPTRHGRAKPSPIALSTPGHTMDRSAAVRISTTPTSTSTMCLEDNDKR